MLALAISDLRTAIVTDCGLRRRAAELRAIRPGVTDTEPVPLALWWALPTTSISDRWWLLRAARPGPKARRLGVLGAAMAARRVLHRAQPEDQAVCAAAIAAAEAWAAEPTEARAAVAMAAGRAASDRRTWACVAAGRAAGSVLFIDFPCSAADAAVEAFGGPAARAAELDRQREDLDRLLRELE